MSLRSVSTSDAVLALSTCGKGYGDMLCKSVGICSCRGVSLSQRESVHGVCNDNIPDNHYIDDSSDNNDGDNDFDHESFDNDSDSDGTIITAIIMIWAPKHINTSSLCIRYLGTISALLAPAVSQHHVPLDILIISGSLLAHPSCLCDLSCLTCPSLCIIPLAALGSIRWPMCKRCAVSRLCEVMCIIQGEHVQTRRCASTQVCMQRHCMYS